MTPLQRYFLTWFIAITFPIGTYSAINNDSPSWRNVGGSVVFATAMVTVHRWIDIYESNQHRS